MAEKYNSDFSAGRNAPVIYNGDKNALNYQQAEEMRRIAQEEAETAALAEEEAYDEEYEEEYDEEYAEEDIDEAFSVDPAPRLTGLVFLAIALTAGIVAVVLYWVSLLGGFR